VRWPRGPRAELRQAQEELTKDPVPLTPRKLGASLWTGPTSDGRAPLGCPAVVVSRHRARPRPPAGACAGRADGSPAWARGHALSGTAIRSGGGGQFDVRSGAGAADHGLRCVRAADAALGSKDACTAEGPPCLPSVACRDPPASPLAPSRRTRWSGAGRRTHPWTPATRRSTRRTGRRRRWSATPGCASVAGRCCTAAPPERPPARSRARGRTPEGRPGARACLGPGLAATGPGAPLEWVQTRPRARPGR
jgi:hypothetical protein